MNKPNVKLTMVGDGTVGKSAILFAYKCGKLPEYIPTIFETHEFETSVNGIPYTVTLIDTGGQEDYARFRSMNYSETTCFILCYAIDNRTSLENIPLKWIPELREYSKTVPILLVATKIDTRAKETDLISYKEGVKMQKKIGAFAFLESSALLNENIHHVIREATKISLKNMKDENSCEIM